MFFVSKMIFSKIFKRNNGAGFVKNPTPTIDLEPKNQLLRFPEVDFFSIYQKDISPSIATIFEKDSVIHIRIVLTLPLKPLEKT